MPFVAVLTHGLTPKQLMIVIFRCDRIVSLELWLVSLSGARSGRVTGAARTGTARRAKPEPAEPGGIGGAETAWRQRLRGVKELVLSLNQCPNVAREEKMKLPLANLFHPSDCSAGGRLRAI